MTCPICGKPTTWKDNPNRPFCSEKCQMIDLGNWVTENYRVPVTTPEEVFLEDEYSELREQGNKEIG